VISLWAGQTNKQVCFSWKGQEIFLFKASTAGMGPTQPSSWWVSGAVSPGVKWLEH